MEKGKIITSKVTYTVYTDMHCYDYQGYSQYGVIMTESSSQQKVPYRTENALKQILRLLLMTSWHAMYFL